jgi:hypothetical protein
MATSPNYAWAEPDNSSLVKNGASDIRTLGDSIDTSVWNVGFGQAAKNKFINGDCTISQRGTTFTNAADGAYTLDRWQFFKDGTASVNVTQETFTPGTAPVAGYEGSKYARLTPSSYTSGNIGIRQNIEDVRTFAGQTVTISFWAKGSVSTSNTILYLQNFGSGGSASVNASAGTVTITTSWARYSVTVAIPSVSGKTIGTSSYLMIQMLRYAANSTVDIWGMQIEYGSKATPFQTATGTIQGELAACQRYFQKSYAQITAPGTVTQQGSIMAAPDGVVSYKSFPNVVFPVIMRSTVTVTIYNPATGTAGLSTGIRNTGASTNIPIFIANTSDSGFQSFVDNSSVLLGAQLMFHYTASSEL